MGFSISNYKRNVKAIKFATKKHSPLLLTLGGIGGLGLTAFTSYKAAKQVVEITEDIEAIRANGGEVDRRHQLLRVGKAILPPVLIGSVSVAAIFGSYHVLNKRNGVLATALSVVTAENKRLTGVLKSKNLLELAAPGVVTDEEYTDEDGQPVTVVDRVDIPQLDSVWFDESKEYASDNHDYNLQFIRAAERKINERQAVEGTITLNEVLYELGIAPKKVGTMFGWADSELITIESTTLQQRDESGNLRPSILITWPMPHYVYDSVDYSGKMPF